MTNIQSLFPTLLYRAELDGKSRLNDDLEDTCIAMSEQDKVGLKWCEKHGYPGYTSYASVSDLIGAMSVFGKLDKIISKHAADFAKELHWEVRGRKPMCDSMWVNVMAEGGSHTSHLHHNSVISGTYYVAVPEGAGPIVFEDPRHATLMAAPPRKSSAPRHMQAQISETPTAGTLMLWESWLRHEVPLNRAAGNRISISFNYVMG